MTMNRSNLMMTIAMTAALALPSMASADESRQGFVVGGGVGPGFVSLMATDVDTQNKAGLATDITIGYGLNSQLIVYGMSRIVWFSLEGEMTFSETAGVGVSYFLSERAPSLFVAAGIGAAVYVQPNVDAPNQIGLGGLVGVGYEFRPHWLAEIDIAYNKPNDDFSTVGVMAKVNYYYY